MKKLWIYLLCIMPLLGVASCAHEEIPESPKSPKIKMTFSAFSDETRTYINAAGTQLLWEDGDDIAIFDNLSSSKNRFSISDIDGSTATFTGEVTSGATEFYAVYPYDAAVSCDEDVVTAVLPEEQYLGEHNASQGAFLAVGHVENGSIKFKNVFARIKIQVTLDDVTEILVSGNNLSGTASFNSDDGTISSVTAGNSTVKLLPPVGDDVFTTGTYYLSLLPGVTPAGTFSVTMKNTFSEESTEIPFYASQTATSAVSITQKGGINFGDIDHKLTWAYHLSTTEHLWAWNEGSWDGTEIFILDNDIELDNDPSLEPWTAHDFAGTFDGKGHAIKKIHVSNSGDANFFGEVSGTIKNLTFGAENDGSYFYGTASSGSCYIAPIKSTTGTAHLESLTNYATVDLRGDSGYCVAGICGGVGNSDNALLSCKNYGAVKVSGNTTTTINLAGVVALTGAGLTGCENHGSVSIENTTAGGTFNFGGVAGYATNAITFENCVNTADLTISEDTTFSGTYFRMGGILSYNNGAGVIMRNCTNEGDLICDAEDFSTRSIYAGGMIGQQQSSSENGIRLTMCTNEGDITLRTLSNGGNVFIGGMIGYRNNNGTASDGIIGVADSACVNLGVLSDYTKKSANNSQNVYMGGMVGWNDMPLALTNCINGESGSAVKGALYEKGQDISPNCTALAGMVGWQTTTASGTDVELAIDGCYNYGPVSNQGGYKTKNIYLAGIVGANEAKYVSPNYVCFNMSITDTHNLGSVSNYCETSSQIRIGGFVGDCANNISISGSSNSGAVSSSSVVTGSLNLRLGGFVGSITRGTTRTFSSCSNTGSISGENTSATALTSAYAAGICAYVNAGTNTFNGCTSSSSVSVSGTVTNKNCAAITAVTAAATGSGITNCGVRGTVSGTTLDSTNYMDYIYCGDKTNLGSGNYYLIN